MATSTFDKEIIIDEAAADVLIALLNKPAPPYPDVSEKFRWLTEEDWECFMQRRSEKSPEQNAKYQ
jgi:hypothetical protein